MKTKLFILAMSALITSVKSQPLKQENMKTFKIDVPESVLTDLQNRLKLTRWTDEPEANGWGYGTNPAYLKELVKYWQTDYDWRKQEAKLNHFPQYKVTIDGVDIHFVYVKGKGTNPKPLILTHGWPDSFYRFYKVIPMLTDPASSGAKADQSFDVIAPSLPGFGFSSQVAMNDGKVAVLWHKLMTKVLGYKNFVAAGGDIGSGVTKELALAFPQSVTSIHLTDVDYPNGTEDKSTLSAPELELCEFIERWWYAEGGYASMHSTKPQTLGYGLNDSPVGLASWIVEKFNSWSDNNGNIENRFTKDELLTNIMIYWVTQTINTSIRTYAENIRASYGEYGPKPRVKAQVPTGVASFPADAPLPKEWAERMVNLKHFAKLPKGGHFAAMEVPDLWVNELRTFFFETKY